MTEKTFTFDFNGSVDLNVGDIWVDGDAPENPTVEDVINHIKKDSPSSLGGFIKDWALDDHIDCSISSSDDDEQTLSI